MTFKSVTEIALDQAHEELTKLRDKQAAVDAHARDLYAFTKHLRYDECSQVFYVSEVDITAHGMFDVLIAHIKNQSTGAHQ